MYVFVVSFSDAKRHNRHIDDGVVPISVGFYGIKNPCMHNIMYMVCNG